MLRDLVFNDAIGNDIVILVLVNAGIMPGMIL
jgi:hypothetical protein